MATLAPHASEVNAGAAVTLSSDELRTLSLRCDRPGLLRLLVHLGLLAISGSAIMLVEHAALRLPGMVVHGIVLSFLFAPLHESVHRTAFRSRFLNQLAGCIGGAVLVLPPEYFRHFHMAHHRYTQDSERDPELLTAKPTSLAGYLLVLSGFEYWYRTCSGLLRRAAGRVPTDLIPPAQRRRIVIEARCFCRPAMPDWRPSPWFSAGIGVVVVDCGSVRRCLASRSCAPICWRSIGAARPCRICGAIHDRRYPTGLSVSLPGTCRITPNIMPMRVYRFMRYPPCPGGWLPPGVWWRRDTGSFTVNEVPDLIRRRVGL